MLYPGDTLQQRILQNGRHNQGWFLWVAFLDDLMKDPRYEVRHFLAPRARMCEEVEEATERYKDTLTLHIVNGNNDLKEALLNARMSSASSCVVARSEPELKLMKVFNVAHHHCWVIRLGMPKTTIVLHEVTLDIDEGKAICSQETEIPPDADASWIMNNLFIKTPKLLDGLYSYVREGGEPKAFQLWQLAASLGNQKAKMLLSTLKNTLKSNMMFLIYLMSVFSEHL